MEEFRVADEVSPPPGQRVAENPLPEGRSVGDAGPEEVRSPSDSDVHPTGGSGIEQLSGHGGSGPALDRLGR